MSEDENTKWATNFSGKSASNTLQLKAEGLPYATVAIKASAPIESKVLDKSFIGYNPNTHQVKWKVVINQNLMKLTNPTISDSIQEGWKYVENSLEVRQNGITVATKAFSYNLETNVLKVELADMAVGDQTYEMTYITQLKDEAKLLTNTTFSVNNHVTLKADEIPASGVVKDVNKSIGLNVLKKSGDKSTFAQDHGCSAENDPSPK